MRRVEDILREASELPVEQRLSLAHKLLVSGEPATSDEIERAWDAEIRKRIDRYDAGESTARPASEVFDVIRRRLQE